MTIWSKRKRDIGLSCTLAALAMAAAHAEVRLPALISDHMVLQQNGPARVWGWAAPGELVTVHFAGQTASANADTSGHWTVWLHNLKPGKSADMTIAGTNKLVVHDVLVGEVWVCSGQSNMERALYFSNNYDKVKAAASNPSIRLFHADHAVAEQPAEDIRGKWELADAKSTRTFSALAYYFSRELQAERHEPVGLIESAYGGTEIQAWMSRDALAFTPALEFVEQDWAAKLADMPRLMADYEVKLAAWKTTLNDADRKKVQAGKLLLNEPGKPRGAGSQAEPVGLYNGMIAPLTPYSIRGILWNQGENNAGPDAFRYRTMFLPMIEDWRKAWGEGEIPFLFVQLSRYRSSGYFPLIRESQQAALQLAHTGMVVSADVGMVSDVHYPDKVTLGHRMRLLADNVAYGQPVEASGPTLQEVTAGRGSLRLWFSDTTGGLQLRTPPDPNFAPLTAGTSPADTADGKAVVAVPIPPAALARSFVIAGADGRFFPATPTIDGATLVLHSEQVAQPTQVCYEWEDTALAMVLWNVAGLPASPFRASLDGRALPSCPFMADKDVQKTPQP
jgi:sialate O-acetylesterase